jgi:NAD kinase
MDNLLKKAVLSSPYMREIGPVFEELGIEVLPHDLSQKPNVVITFGGDGSFLSAESAWPGVPKVILRRSRVCKTCRKEVPRKVLQSLMKKDHAVREFPKIAFKMGLIEGVAANDIILRNWNPNQAIRFSLSEAQGASVSEDEVIGDGLVLATPIGAAAYYRSIVRQEFKSGFGLAFNNPTIPLSPIHFEGKFSVKVKILRENALLCLDNLPSFWVLKIRDSFTLTHHPGITRIVDILSYYCDDCQGKLAF